MGKTYGFGSAAGAVPSEMGKNFGFGSAAGAVPSEMGLKLKAALLAAHRPPLLRWLEKKGIAPSPAGSKASGICPVCPPEQQAKGDRPLCRFDGRICASCATGYAWDERTERPTRVPRTNRGRVGDGAVGRGMGGATGKLSAIKAADKAGTGKGGGGSKGEGKGGGGSSKGGGGGVKGGGDTNSLAEAWPLFLLADALDTNPTVLQALGRALVDRPDLALSMAVGELKVDLQLKGRLHDISSGGFTYRTVCTGGSPVDIFDKTLVAEEAFEPHMEAFPSAVAQELKSWLHLAGRLNLVPLARLLVGFVKTELMPYYTSILLLSVGSVFSPRVLQFMPRELLLEGFVRDALMERPAQAVITSKEDVQLTAITPLTAAWFREPLGASIETSLRQHGHCWVMMPYGGGVVANVTLGGPSVQECAKLVDEAVAAALEEGA
ncbi:hypothetical protein HYH03_007671 [Edaphochlamys debaryana]|uniref:Uncharacterized protein n=1 Tax=Edaphochlamys debaryana TaxID=47281 RepID=A0A835Y417_9CHLO|nr:hypothetical protein HYH03_007671 [Edaphochlamys debaryana]|eukprot:KAG2494318.1 hypothetical protein HYH03_007671 [Edaphochlamys debaryana]